MTTKPCTRCRIHKPLPAFAKQNESPDGRRPMCKECEREARATKKEQMKEYGKKYFTF